jgi:hypothetical protein
MRKFGLILTALVIIPFCTGCMSVQERDETIELAGQTAYTQTMKQLEDVEIHPECREKVAEYAQGKAEKAADKSLPEGSGTGKAIFGILLAGAKLALGAFAGVKI